MGRLSDIVLRGLQFEAQQEAQDLENQARKLQMDDIIKNRVQEKLRTSRGYIEAWSKITDPATRTEELGKYAGSLGADVQDAMKARQEMQAIHARNQYGIASLMGEAEAEAAAAFAGFDDVDVPTGIKLPPSVVSSAISARGAGERTRETTTGAMDRAKLRADVTERASLRTDASRRLALELQERFGAERMALLNKSINIARDKLDRGGLDFNELVDMFAQLQAGNEAKFASAEQLEIATAAAGTAWDAVLGELSAPEAISLALREHDVRPGKPSKDAQAAADKFRERSKDLQVPPPEVRPATTRAESTEPVRDDEAIMKAALAKLKLEDNEKNRARIRALQASRRR